MKGLSDKMMKLLLAPLALALALTACGGSDDGGTDAASPGQDKTLLACQALAQEPPTPPDLYAEAVDEWNAHADANDATYLQFTNAGGFDAWATANGKPTEPVETDDAAAAAAAAADDAADQVLVDAAGGPLADKVKEAQEAAAQGDLDAVFKAAAEMQLICSTKGVTLQ